MGGEEYVMITDDWYRKGERLIIVEKRKTATSSNRYQSLDNPEHGPFYINDSSVQKVEKSKKVEVEEENPEKLLIDGIILLKELKAQRQQEISKIDAYLKRFDMVDSEETTAEPTEMESSISDGSEKTAVSKEKPKKVRKVKKLDPSFVEEFSEKDDASESGDTVVSSSGEDTSEKIFCAVCNKYHTKGTHD